MRLLVLALVLTSCSKRAPKDVAPGAPSMPTCFDRAARTNSAGTKRVFELRGCQGGGVTWGGLLHALASRRGRLVPAVGPMPGYTGGVYALGASTLAIDDEGDAAHVCSDDPKLLAALRADADGLDADVAKLRAELDRANPLQLECTRTAGGGLAALPTPYPMPVAPASEIARQRDSIARIVALIAREPAWCLPEHSVLGNPNGVLRLLPDGTASITDPKGKTTNGTWKKPMGTMDLDGRIRVEAGSDLALDVGESGALGERYVTKEGVQREDFVPGSKCLH